jgi:hypothetical protein
VTPALWITVSFAAGFFAASWLAIFLKRWLP